MKLCARRGGGDQVQEGGYTMINGTDGGGGGGGRVDGVNKNIHKSVETCGAGGL